MNRVDLPGEHWKPVPGWEGFYEVSNQGRVYSCRRPGVARTGRVLRDSAMRDGHRVVSLYRNGHRKARPIHVLVMLAFAGPRPDGMPVRHLDGNPRNNHLVNLRYGTVSENNQDTVRHGRHWQANKTHCKHGHPYDQVNTCRTKDGRRSCRTCVRLRSQRLRSEQRAAA